MTQRYEIEAWLNDQWPTEQTKDLAAQIGALGDDATEADWVVVCQASDDTFDMTERTAALTRAVNFEAGAREDWRAGIRHLAREGVSEVEISHQTGATRMTVRKALGK